MNSLAALTMGQARRLVAAGEIDPADLGPWPASGDTFGALTWVPDPGIRVPGDPRLPLSGFPAALKANICKTGWPADCGSKILSGYRSPFSSTAVSRLEKAGALFTAVAAMDEFGMGSSCEYAASGPVTNPWDMRCIPGGSSGGSAAAVAAGLVWYALGSDTGGSVRFPAHCCGLVGFKPTWGRVSRYGLVPFASSLDTIGVLARDVADAALVMTNLAGGDPRDATCLQAKVPDLEKAVGQKVKGLRVGVPRALLERQHAPDLLEDFANCLNDLAKIAVTIVDVDLPEARESVALYQIIACAEAASNLARYDGSFYGQRVRAGGYQGTCAATRTAGLGSEVKRRIMWGTHVLSEGYRDRLYLKALALRRQLKIEFARAFERVDAVALPTAPCPAVPLGTWGNDPVGMHAVDVYTAPASLAGLPALTVPTGVDRSGLPLSIQLVGPELGEAVLVRLGGALEKIREFRDRKQAPWNRT